MVDSIRHHRVCVIGAGPCGLTTIRNLINNDINDIVCYEAQDTIGGLWAYSSDQNRPSVYQSAHIISSKRLSAFRDFPMPDDYPDYPSQRQLFSYFSSYAEKFNLKQHIRFRTEVIEAVQGVNGGWQLTVRDPDGMREETADYLIVASGHHRIPFTPPLEGSFSGTQIHSSQYRDTGGFEDKRVLIVGAGNSACDIAAALSRVSDHISLSLRTPQFIIPKTVLGRPIDVQYRKLQKFPRFVRNTLLNFGLRALVGPYERYGLPQPSFDILSTHPTLNTDILERLTHGKVAVRRATTSADGNMVTFADSTAAPFDTIIWATGYQTRFPYLSNTQFDWSQSTKIPLYMKIMPVDVTDIFFIGLIQPLGCIWALADYQAEIVARAINGTWNRPENIAAKIEQEHAEDAKRYRPTTRHAVEVDYHDYIGIMQRELVTTKKAA